jgi:hypothetical protein
MLYTFIWKSSVNRVKKDIMQKKYQEGGLKMINIHSFILALKSTWIRRLFFTVFRLLTDFVCLYNYDF